MATRTDVTATSDRTPNAGRRLRFRKTRALAVIAASLVLAAVVGDRSRAATGTDTVHGQDPLEVLTQKVRPNVIVVLDSSGSMKWNLSAGSQPPSNYFPPMDGGHPRSKLWQAKHVLKRIVHDNQDSVSFLFGQYNQADAATMQNTGATTGNSQNRFAYSTYSCTTACPQNVTGSFTNSPDNDGLVESATMTDDELGVVTDAGGGGSRGLQSWQLIYPAWDTLYYEEEAATGICEARLPAGSGPDGEHFYARGGKANVADAAIAGSFAADLASAMNNPSVCTRSATKNTYDVTYSAGVFTITRTKGSGTFRPRWPADAVARPKNIAGALGSPSGVSAGSGPFSTRTPFTLLYKPKSPTATNGSDYGADTWVGFTYKFAETVGATTATVYSAYAGRFFNGEVIKVQSDGQICDMSFPTAAQRTNPPSFTIQKVNVNCGTDVNGAAATFRWGGAYYRADSTPCSGFKARVGLIPCDLKMPPAPTQLANIAPWLDDEFPLDATGMPHQTPLDNTTGAAAASHYVENTDGTWGSQSFPPTGAGGIKGWGATPIAQSLVEIKGQFDILWSDGGSAMTPPNNDVTPIKDHLDPKEKTIVLFVTDGEDTCASQGDQDRNALAAAYRAEQLHKRIVSSDAASGVQTFVIGFGGAFASDTAPRLDWIAWGGSGLVSDGTYSGLGNDGSRWTLSYSGPYSADCSTSGSQCKSINSKLKAWRDQCLTCEDAILAPDAATLRNTLQAIIDQTAEDREFTAQQSITLTVFEYADIADEAEITSAEERAARKYRSALSPSDPSAAYGRYSVIVPTLFLSSFSLPGFRGQVRAYQNDGNADPALQKSVLRWSAGPKLKALVTTGIKATGDGMSACTVGGEAGACGFVQLHGGHEVLSSSVPIRAIKRRIFTTTRNGVFPFTPASLIDQTASGRETLWPPSNLVAPDDYTNAGSLDAALGLPLDSAALPQTEFDKLQTQFRVCKGTNPPSGCSSSDALTKMKAARREAREIILAFTAGARPVLSADGLKRTNAEVSQGGVTVPANAVLYVARDWVLADSDLATAALMTPPMQQTPVPYNSNKEYEGFRDGLTNTGNGLAQLLAGFGLRNPDHDIVYPTPANRDPEETSQLNLKPAMSVIYVPANDMLHAFRAGPSKTPAVGNCVYSDLKLQHPSAEIMMPEFDCGGEELWGFIPYDQLGTMRLRYLNEPQDRAHHVYSLARGIRFADVFVPNRDTNGSRLTGNFTKTVAGKVVDQRGVWRRVLFFGRGIGGKYMTALDVTGMGPYTRRFYETGLPIPLWSRGNPDTSDGSTDLSKANGYGGQKESDYDAYSKMGETWSMPVVTYFNSYLSLYDTSRNPAPANSSALAGVDFVLYVGSGYSAKAGEGTTFYTLDALSGDVIATADIEAAAAANGLNRTLSYPNALVANPVGYNPTSFNIRELLHPTASYPDDGMAVRRVYFADVHGRFWKLLPLHPETAIPVADLGQDQPVGTAAALIALPFYDPHNPPVGMIPHIYVTSGADSRQNGPFKMFGFRDEGDDYSTATTGSETHNDVTTFAPATLLKTEDDQYFARTFDQGSPAVDCGYTTETYFRGTVQPATTYEVTSTGADLRVFFSGTRLDLPNTRFAPPTPLACGQGQYPCRSQFDSIIYALGGQTGLAAFDLNSSGDDAYRIFLDSRITAISFQTDPSPDNKSHTRFNKDEGISKTTGGVAPPPPPPPPPPGDAIRSAPSVLISSPSGGAPQTVRVGSSVCPDQP